MKLRLLFLFPMFLSITACQLLEKTEEAPEVVDPEPAVEPEQVAEEPGRLTRAIEWLQEGEPTVAEDLLEDYLSEHPGHRLAGLLLDQIRRDPGELLGEDYVAIVVQPGDTLSQLAARHAGDGMLFYALARLNDIEQPRLLQPDTVLRVPASPEEPADPGDDAQRVAGELLERGDSEQAFSLLLSIARSGQMDESERDALAQTALVVSDDHLEAGRIDEAENVLDQIAPWREEMEKKDAVARQHDRIAARRALNAAEQAAVDGDGEAEIALLLEAIELDPEFAAAEAALAEASPRLVEHYHDLALKAWREQEVEQAVAYWERVVGIDSDFEPARIYLERAREVLRRLEEL